MLNIERLKFVAVEELQPGEFARLSDYGNALVVVGTIHTMTMVTFLEGPIDGVTCIDRADLYGRAMVLEGVKVEVDPGRWGKDEGKIGCLLRDGTALALQVTTHHRETFCTIRTDFDDKTTRRVFFYRWRAVIRDGDRDEILFEFECEQERQAD